MSSQAELQTERIVLTGFMGSGKSTVGKRLAQRLGWSFVDLDSAIEERCRQSVPEIFAEHGEAHFRAQESDTLAPLLERSHIVIALGGGAPETPANRLLLQDAVGAETIYLEAPFDTLHQRCSDQAKEPNSIPRPLLADRDGALNRFHSRQKHYTDLATFRLNTANMSAEETVEAILAHLQ